MTNPSAKDPKGVIVPILGVLLALGLSFGLGWINARESIDRKAIPAGYAAAAKADARRSCSTGDAAAIAECVEKKIAGSFAYAHDELDLTAQQYAAYSALGTLALSVAALAVSIIGLFYVKRTFEASLSTVTDARKATMAAIRQAELAEQNQRPWLSIKIVKLTNFHWSLEGQLCCSCIVEVANSGNQPAIGVSLFVDQFPKKDNSFDRETFLKKAQRLLPMVSWAVPPSATERLTLQNTFLDTEGINFDGTDAELSLPLMGIGVAYHGPKSSELFTTVSSVLVSPNPFARNRAPGLESHWIAKTLMD